MRARCILALRFVAVERDSRKGQTGKRVEAECLSMLIRVAESGGVAEAVERKQIDRIGAAAHS